MERAGVGCGTQLEQSDPKVLVHSRTTSVHLAVAIEYSLTSRPHPPMALAIGDGWYPS